MWWGLLLFCCKLGSRRQLDFDLRDGAPHVLANVNRLAGTRQKTLPVHDTLDHFLGHLGSAPLATIRTRMLRRLLRMKVLDEARLLGRVVIAIDGTGHLHFARQHCPQCLVQHHDTHDVYLHMVEEAKLVGPGGMALSIGTAFIENTEVPARGDRDAEQWKQDCEVTALRRLLPALKEAFPQTPICLTGDALYACGPIIELGEAQGWTYVFTFKPGRLPAVWADFQAVLGRSPEQTRQITLPDGTRQVYRWASGLTAEGANHRLYSVNAVQCEETTVEGETTTFAWITNLPVNRDTVVEIATKGGRCRWRIENQGFNVQKNSELHLEHAYSSDPDGLKAYYYLLQIAHIMLQLLERGSLLRQLAAAQGKTVLTLFGSLKNIARRLLENLRHGLLPEEPRLAIQIRFDTS